MLRTARQRAAAAAPAVQSVRSRALLVYAPAALSGVLYILGLPPYGLGVLGWVAILPLLVAVRRATRLRQAVLAGAVAGFVACAGGFFWIAEMAHRFWDVSWPLAGVLLGIFGTFGEINLTLFAALAWLVRRRLAVLPAAATAALFVICEIVTPKIFPDALGHTALALSALPYAAALAGTHGLSFFMAWMAAALAALLAPRAGGDGGGAGAGLRAGGTHRRRWAEFGLCAAAAAALWTFGAWRGRSLGAQPPARHLALALVQSNVGDPEALADSLGNVTQAIDSCVSEYARLTRKSLAERPADLVVWPETAVPAVPRERVLARLQELVRETKTPLLFGAYDFETVARRDLRVYNAAFLLQPTGEIASRYYKHHLLLLGEYVPLSERFPVLLRLLPMPGEFSPGPGPRVFRAGGCALSPLICYEVLFPSYVRQGLRAGGEVLVNLTNDYWFGAHGEPVQHLALSRMRAFETGRPIVRATNTGISALIDARGEVVAQSALWRQQVLRATLPVPEMRWTPYARWGEWMTAAAMALACAAVALTWRLLR